MYVSLAFFYSRILRNFDSEVPRHYIFDRFCLRAVSSELLPSEVEVGFQPTALRHAASLV